MAITRTIGRPKGSGKKDGPTLELMAEAILAEPGLRPTLALRRIVPDPSQAVIRRLVGKWKSSKGELLKAAKARKEKQETVRQVRLQSDEAHAYRVPASYPFGFDVGYHLPLLNASKALADRSVLSASVAAYEAAQRCLATSGFDQGMLGAVAKAQREFEQSTVYKQIRESERLARQMADNDALWSRLSGNTSALYR